MDGSRCTYGKRAACRWALASYNSVPVKAEGDLEPPALIAKAAMLAPLIERDVSRSEAAAGLLIAARLLLASVAPLRGERHLVLIGSGDACGLLADAYAIGEQARYHAVSIHGLAL